MASNGPDVTPRQKELVQSTWEQVVSISDRAGRLFYGRLFDLDPQLRPLFPAGEEAIEDQARKLMQMITTAVRGLDRPDEVIPAVEDLGRRHVDYGVRDGDYDTVGTALLWTLERGLGDAFTPQVRDAWAATYALLASVMQEAAAAAPGRAGYRSDARETARP